MDEDAVIADDLMAFWQAGDRAGADARAAELAQDAQGRWAPAVRGFAALWELEDIATANGVEARFRPGIWWMRGPYPGDFGDILTPYVLWHAFGVMPRWTPASDADGLCIGSVATFARTGTRVWGSGMTGADDPLAPDALWAALRGPLSRDAVIAAGGTVSDVYGDGAVLLPQIHAPPVIKSHEVGVIPDVLQEDRLRMMLSQAGRADEVKVISMRAADFADIERVIADIRSCHEIVSTSLHGVIVAHAYGVPCQSARWIGAGEVAEDGFDMRDYKASVGLGDVPIGIPAASETLDWLDARRCVLPPRPIDTERLRAAFPFETPMRALSGGGRDVFAQTRALIAAGRMADAVAASADPAHQLAQPRLVLLRLAALMAAAEADEVAAFAGTIMADDRFDRFRFAIIRQLARGGHAGLAADLMIADTRLHDRKEYRSVATLVGVNMTDVAHRRRLRKTTLIRGGAGKGARVRAAGHAYAPQPVQTVIGTVRLLCSPTTPPHHVPGLEAEVAAVHARIAAPRQPDILEHRDVFTDARGQVWRSDGRVLIQRSQPITQFDPVPAARIDTAVAMNRGTRGIYHWIVDYLPKLAWLLERQAAGEDVPTILLNGRNGGFERQSIELLGLSDHAVAVEPEGPVHVDRLLFPRLGFSGLVGWSHLDAVFDRIVARSLEIAQDAGAALPARLYITRRTALRRRLVNEDAVEAAAAARGFAIVDFASVPLWHQIAMAHRAETIMSPHGAGLCHIIFARPGLRVIELLPIQDGTYQLRFNYARLSILKGHDYTAWLEPQPPALEEWRVDMAAFLPVLESMLG